MNELLISKSDILHNIEVIKSKINAKIIAVIKCDGYGLGLFTMAELLKDFGCFGITETWELEALRGGSYTQDMLIMRSSALASDNEIIVKYDGIANVGSHADATALATAAKVQGKTARAHISIDTGMARDGFGLDDTAEIQKLIKQYPEIKFEGIFTHFNSSFTDKVRTKTQLDAFLAYIGKLESMGVSFESVHAANSSAAFNLPESILSCARIGSAFIGRLAVKSDLRPVGITKTVVSGIKEVKKGENIGYLAAHKVKRAQKLAVLPIGTHDGFGTCPSPDINNFKIYTHSVLSGFKKLLRGTAPFMVTINGKRYPTVGHIGSNHTLVDITNSNIKIGDECFIDMNPMHIMKSVKRVVIETPPE